MSKAETLRWATNHADLVLIIESNNFGDQIIKVRHETKAGYQKYIWTELNHEGSHRNITPNFIEYIRQKFNREVPLE
jgi:hypothetical protein